MLTATGAMPLSIAHVLWAAGFFTDAALVFVLLYRHRYRTVPWFTIWVAFDLLNRIVSRFVLASGRTHTQIQQFGAFLSLLLQLAVLPEIVRHLLRGGRPVKHIRMRPAWTVATALLLACGLAGFTPPASGSRFDIWGARADLLITLVLVIVLVAIIISSRLAAIQWRSYVMRESHGFASRALAALAAGSLPAHWHIPGHPEAFSYLRSFTFEAVSLYWTAVFWFPDPDSIRPWNEVLRSVGQVDLQGLTAIAESYLKPGPSFLEFEPNDMWRVVGGYEGLATIRQNSRAMYELAVYVPLGNGIESVVVSEILRQDAKRIAGAVFWVRVAILTRYGYTNVPFRLPELIASYCLMRGRLFHLYETHHAELLPRLKAVL